MMMMMMSEQEKKRQRIYDFLNTETKSKFLCLPYTMQRTFFFQKKSFLRKRGSEGFNQKRKEGSLTALATVIKKDPQRQQKAPKWTESIRENCEDSN